MKGAGGEDLVGGDRHLSGSVHISFCHGCSVDVGGRMERSRDSKFKRTINLTYKKTKTTVGELKD